MSKTEKHIIIVIVALIILWLLSRNKNTTQTQVTATIGGVPVTKAQQNGSLLGLPVAGNADSPDPNNTPPGSNQFNNLPVNSGGPITSLISPTIQILANPLTNINPGYILD